MFTGIVEAFAGARYSSGKLYVEVPFRVEPSESIAVNGACLTVSEFNGRVAVFDVGEETLARTNLREARIVNLERALKLGDRVGGHFVTGHVDGTLRFLTSITRGNTVWMAFELPRERWGVAEKGSIALNGVSLTVARVESSRFWVQVIPHTLKNTNLQFLSPGDRVNYEIDILARYVRAVLNR
ncbi:riboflavin synthase subunit alpha [Thermococcus chitonophagus]|uniref:Riboflavin synthase n=1 Tax=Thermococcus chitonophagus TaxID=54262 RepID=A0A160VRF4_9EURY|nr:riboflavin synthase [Thermococcus chitonophagus]ASJ15702.1 riboflavin synthase subunit alpha [Thermococcus chitonophagus]CUX76916.1 Riboflavin synthase eubacterial/eukaryotic [Thermococcus chitonophagus]